MKLLHETTEVVESDENQIRSPFKEDNLTTNQRIKITEQQQATLDAMKGDPRANGLRQSLGLALVEEN